MGDRVSVQITVNVKDKDRVVSQLGGVFETEVLLKNNKVELWFDEVNHGGFSELVELAKEIDFVGWSGAGGNFGAFVFCSVGSTGLSTVECSHEGHGFVVYYDMKTKQPSQADIKNIEVYIDKYNKFMEVEHETDAV